MFFLKKLSRFFITKEEIESKLFEVVKRYTEKEVLPSSKFSDLNLEDTDYLEIIAVVEASLRADLKPEAVSEIESFPQLVSMLLDNLNNPVIKKDPEPESD